MPICNLSKKSSDWKSYIIAKALSTKKQVGLINQKKFATSILNQKRSSYSTYGFAITDSTEYSICIPMDLDYLVAYKWGPFIDTKKIYKVC